MPKSKKTKHEATHTIRLYRHDGEKRSFHFRGAAGSPELGLAKARRFVLEKADNFAWILLYDAQTDQLIEEYDETKTRIIR